MYIQKVYIVFSEAGISDWIPTIVYLKVILASKEKMTLAFDVCKRPTGNG